tara:strand:+ start:1609 stop:2073 length:465 start_codon:yes stop_codon:yes gene_type:complete
MKANDLIIGALTLLVGLLLLITSFDYPALPGQAYGAGTMPRLLGGLGIGLGVALLVKGWRGGVALVSLDAWARDRRAIGVAGTLVTTVFVILVSGDLGFVVTAIIAMFAMMLIGGIRVALALVVSVSASLVIYLAFSRLLLVPLPRGPVENLLW